MSAIFLPLARHPRKHGSRRTTRKASRSSMRCWNEPHRPTGDLRRTADRRAANHLADVWSRLGITPRVNQTLTEPKYSTVGHSGRVCWLTASSKRACVPMALDPEEIVTMLLLAALVMAWNWRLGH